MDVHHGGAHAHAGYQCFKTAFVFTVIVAHVSGSAAHVKADQPVEAAHRRATGHAHYPACRTGKYSVLAPEPVGIGQAAVRLHEHEARTGAVPDTKFVGNLLHITAQDGR